MNREHVDKIEDYLLGLLSEEDNKVMQEAIETDPQLKEEVAVQSFEQDIMHEIIADKLRNEMQDWDATEKSQDNIPSSGKIIKFNPRHWIIRLSVAASVLLILGVSLRLTIGNQYSFESIAGRYAAQEEIGFGRGNHDNAIDLSKGEAAYVKKNYPEAIAFFSKINPQDSAYLYGQFMLGKALMGLKNYVEADRIFSNIGLLMASIKQNDAPETIYLKESAEWSNLLVLLAKSDTGERFESILAAILNDPQHNYYPLAKKLNEELQNPWTKWLN